MDIMLILKIVAAILTGLNIYYSWRKRPDRRSKILLAISFVLFYISVYVVKDDETVSETWIRHLFFYSGELFFYFYVVRFLGVANPLSNGQAETSEAGAGSKLAAAMGLAPVTVKDWFLFLTAQGIQHILTAPVFFLILARIRVEFISLVSRRLKIMATLLMVGLCFLVLMHIQEFLVDSQKLIPLDEDFAEPLEIGWYLVAMLIFLASWRQPLGNNSNHAQK